MSMTPTQLELLLGYISNEIASVGMPWSKQRNTRSLLVDRLRASVTEIKTETEPTIKKDSKPPHDGANRFSPLMIEMLLFVYHSGRNFSSFPNLSYRAQQQAYNWFLVNDYFKLVDCRPSVELTPKGQALVEKILYTKLD